MIDEMKKIDDFVENADSIVISGHIRPDGDCTGSVLALYNYIELNYPRKRVHMFLEDPGDKYAFLKNCDMIDHEYAVDIACDLMIALDTSTCDRLGKAEKYLHTAAHSICIDHHVSNSGYADENYIYGDASSTAEVLFNFLDKSRISKEIAECLYVGIISDTGVFKYPSTSPDTMRTAALLMEFGIDTDRIIDICYFEQGYDELRIVGLAFNRSRLTAGGRIIYSYITKQDMDEYNVTTRELESIVSQLRQVKGVICAVFMYETNELEYKFSLRSSGNYNVNSIASAFGGGGHIHAAGCSLRGEGSSCLEAILIKVKEALN